MGTTGPRSLHGQRAAAPGSATDIVRLDLACGSVEALHAIRFTSRFPRHFHDTFAIGVIEAGATRVETAAGTWLAEPGDILAFSPGEIHRADPADGRGYTFRMVYPGLDLMRSLGAEPRPGATGRWFECPVVRDPAVARDLLGAHAPLMAGGPAARGESSLITGLRALVARHAGGRANPGEQPRASERDLALSVRDYLAGRFASRIPLALLAEVFGVNPFQLLRVFRRVIGVPPHAYLVQLRVNRAQDMLRQGHGVTTVAYACGFSDQSHLTRVFKKAVGVPPGQYLRAIARTPTLRSA